MTNRGPRDTRDGCVPPRRAVASRRLSRTLGDERGACLPIADPLSRRVLAPRFGAPPAPPLKDRIQLFVDLGFDLSLQDAQKKGEVNLHADDGVRDLDGSRRSLRGAAGRFEMDVIALPAPRQA